MLSNDSISKLSTVTKPQNRKKTTTNPAGENRGGLCIEKVNGGQGFGTEVGGLLYDRDGTIEWNIHDSLNGLNSFNNIHQYIAAEIRARGGNLRTRITASEAYEHEARSGINSLAKWLDDMWGIPLYRCTTPESGNRIVTITIDPEYVVNHDTGETAQTIQKARDIRAIDGQTMASALRLARIEGKDIARTALMDAVNSGLESFTVPEPRRLTTDE